MHPSLSLLSTPFLAKPRDVVTTYLAHGPGNLSTLSGSQKQSVPASYQGSDCSAPILHIAIKKNKLQILIQVVVVMCPIWIGLCPQCGKINFTRIPDLFVEFR